MLGDRVALIPFVQPVLDCTKVRWHFEGPAQIMSSFLKSGWGACSRADTDRDHAMCGVGREHTGLLQPRNIIIKQSKSALPQLQTHLVWRQLAQGCDRKLPQMSRWRIY